jgi:hypothetical protein
MTLTAANLIARIQASFAATVIRSTSSSTLAFGWAGMRFGSNL